MAAEGREKKTAREEDEEDEDMFQESFMLSSQVLRAVELGLKESRGGKENEPPKSAEPAAAQPDQSEAVRGAPVSSIAVGSNPDGSSPVNGSPLGSSRADLDLSKWDLPSPIVDAYANKGIERMFPWQAECLMAGEGSVLAGKNLIYSAPTSAGKTLVAEVLLMRRLLETGSKAIVILPFVSLAREKMFHLRSLLEDVGLRVNGFMGGQAPAGGMKTTDVAVATIEKANSIINRLLEGGELGQICCVVVDELHLLGDPSRGYLLELLLTKIQYASGSGGGGGPAVQIIGMSATLPNLDDLAGWLSAELYTTQFRPVPLTERIKVGSTLFGTDLRPVRTLVPTVVIKKDTDHLTWLCLETVLGGHSVLLFCPIKSWVEKMAEALARDFFNIGCPDPTDRDPASCDVRAGLQGQLDASRIGEILQQLTSCPAGLDSTLANTIRFGVAFHHAGLTTDERDIVEAAFKTGAVRVLVATSTLSSGVNLPARRVILRCPTTFNGQMMDRLTYKQMVGRAGRKGVDTEGESILLCKESERTRVAELVQGDLEPVVSCLAGVQRPTNKLAASMKRALLEVIVSGSATTQEEVVRYASCTLLATQMADSGGRQESILECVRFLESNEFIRLQDVGDGEQGVRYVATRLGMACLASSLSPDEGLSVFAELQKARRQLVLENELHMIYLIVPIYAAVSWPKLDWMAFLEMWEGLSEDMQRVGRLVGVEERWMVRAMRGTLRTNDPAHSKVLATHQRFYTALALQDLIHEVPVCKVAIKYGASKGMLQSLQQAASTFSGMVTVFCAKLGWNSMELLMGQFQDRLEFGVQRELIELCRIDCVNGAKARALFDAGYKTVSSLAASHPSDVENVLHKIGPFSSSKSCEGTSDKASRNIRNVFITGRKAMTEEDLAKLIVLEARYLMQRDLGLKPEAWTQGSGPQEIGKESSKSGSVVEKKIVLQNITASQQNKRTHSLCGEVDSLKQDNDVKSVSIKNIALASVDTNIEKTPVAVRKRKSEEVVINQAINTDKIEQVANSGSCTKSRKKESQKRRSSLILSTSFDVSGIMETIFMDESEEVDMNGCQLNFEKEKVSSDRIFSTDNPEIVKRKRQASSEDMFSSDELVTPVKCWTKPAKVTQQVGDKEFSLQLSESDVAGESDNKEQKPAKDSDNEDLFLSDSVLNSDFDYDEEILNVCPEGRKSSAAKTEKLVSTAAKQEKIVHKELKPPERLNKLRKRRKRDAKMKTSPGVMILSDSESDHYSPAVAKEAARSKFEAKGCLNAAPAAQKPQSCCVEYEVVDCNLAANFASFEGEWRAQKHYCLQFIYDSAKLKRCQNRRRMKLMGKGASADSNSSPDSFVLGLVVCWTQNKVYYMDLESDESEPSQVPMNDKVKLLKQMATANSAVCSFLWRRTARTTYDLTGRYLAAVGRDPAVAVWLLNPAADLSSLDKLTATYMPEVKVSCRRAGENIDQLALRAAKDVVLTSCLEARLEDRLEKPASLYGHYTNVEMATERILGFMELVGLGVNEKEFESTQLILEGKLRMIEEEAYRLAGRQFVFNSSRDVSQLLYKELRLPVNGDPKLSLEMVKPGRKGLKLSTNKEILAKLSSVHELPACIIEHRRLTTALDKTLVPLLEQCRRHPVTGTLRVYPSVAAGFTATGRVAMHEPNVQNVPRDFELDIPDELRQKILRRGRRQRRRQAADESALALSFIARHLSDDAPPVTRVSLRNAVVPSDGNLILTADYSQLELRVMAHLSKDERLIQALTCGGDVFRSLAGDLHNCPPDEVTSEQRQQAKQVVYGLLYGMGDKTMGDQLNVDRMEAARFMDGFKRRYPTLKAFLLGCLADCRKTGGYVETVCGRRRQLGDIYSTNAYKREAAERQAINTTVQGSASDLVKAGMVRVEKSLGERWPNRQPFRWTAARENDSADWSDCRGARLILQLHDELLYEVHGEDVMEAANIIKTNMESALPLSVPTPVVVKKFLLVFSMEVYNRLPELSLAEKKQESDAKLQIEKENLEWLKERCSESEQLTGGMVDILTSFEERLGKLEATILPVYQETGNLQRRQENIDKTLSELDHVINYYNVSKEVENTVREGPNGSSLDAFIQAMSKLKEALDYFTANNPASTELDNVRTLYTTGGSALSREFSELVKKHSQPVRPIDILNSVSAADSVSGDEVSHASSDDFTSIIHFPEEVQSSMIRIAEWLCVNGLEGYMNIYATVRASVMEKSLEQLRDYQRNCSGGSHGRGLSPANSRKFASPAAATAVQGAAAADMSTPTSRKLSTQSRKLTSAMNRKISSMSTKLEAATGLAVGRRGLGTPVGGADEANSITELEVDLFLTTVSGLQRLMASEQQLMPGIIPYQFQKKNFEVISRGSLELVAREGKAITSKVKRLIENYDFVGVMTLFHLLRHMTAIKPQFDKTLEGCDTATRNKYHAVLAGLKASGTMALDGFIDGIRTDSTTRERMPKDGTVFELTSNILMYLEQLVDYMDTISDILGQDASYNQALVRLPRRILPTERPQALLGLYIKKVLVQLNLTFINKSNTYTDPFLKAVFRLNNSMYIVRSLNRSGLMDLVSLSAPECQITYEEMITEQKRLYSQSWERVLNYIWSGDDIPSAVLLAPGRLNEKSCKIIKEKFSGFNKEIEDIASTQKHYSIPDVELRESLKRDNKEYILPKYNSFYEKYANVQFSKNPEKYIKYTPAQISGLIDSFFDVAA